MRPTGKAVLVRNWDRVLRVGLNIEKFTDLWLAFAYAAVVLSASFINGSPLRLLLFGAKDGYVPDISTRVFTIVALVAGFLLLGAVQFAFNTTSTAHQAYKTDKSEKEAAAIETKRLADEAEAERLRRNADFEEAERARKAAEAEAERQRIGKEKLKEELEQLKEQGFEVKATKALDKLLRLTLAEKPAPPEDFMPSRVVAYVDDNYGNKTGLVVFHIFDGKAFWKINRASAFEDSNGKEIDFIDKFWNSPDSVALNTYDMIIGIGLESNTPKKDPEKSSARAMHLCSLLYDRASEGLKSDVYGLDIGVYRGDDLDTIASPARYQRSVIIVGVEAENDKIYQPDLLEEIIKTVKYSGVDLSQYSKLRPSASPRWWGWREC